MKMELYPEQDNFYTLSANGVLIELKGYEIIDFAQQVIEDQYPNVFLDIEETLKEKEARYQLLIDRYSEVKADEAAKMFENNKVVYRYSRDLEKMILLSEADFPLELFDEEKYFI